MKDRLNRNLRAPQREYDFVAMIRKGQGSAYLASYLGPTDEPSDGAVEAFSSVPQAREWLVEKTRADVPGSILLWAWDAEHEQELLQIVR